ncbi:VanZ family protein [Microvirga sp. 2TAF3]|uniref:VanZ family protein n=1 Tax=Microvirga sp. 2TAF3 TaxID=3233014 RepID=UPI003F950943
MNRIVLRILAWLLVTAVAIFTLSPIELRPMTGAPADFERLAAFALVGGMFCLAYPRHRIAIVLFLIGVAGLLEVMQHIVPGRHGRSHDFAVKAVAVVTGSILTILIERITTRTSSEPVASQDVS